MGSLFRGRGFRADTESRLGKSVNKQTCLAEMQGSLICIPFNALWDLVGLLLQDFNDIWWASCRGAGFCGAGTDGWGEMS